MSHAPRLLDFRASAQERIALRFAQALARVHRFGGGADTTTSVLEACAARCWNAALQLGHACIPLGAEEASLLATSPAVASVEAAGDDAMALRDAPLVLDGHHLFLERLWRAERGLAAALRSLASSDPLAAEDRLAAEIGAAFGGYDPRDAQQRAVHVALTRRLAVVSGGPGTGKTTTLARLITAYARLAPQGRVAIAAPTGKAAARVSEALHAQLAAHHPGDELAGRMPQNATTLHRLLGFRGPASRPQFGAARPLPFDLIVVDEASMIDLEMAGALVAAVGTHARLVLSGDRDQLASVEAGAVFAAVCAAQHAGLHESIVTLESNYRQREAPAIAAWAQAARLGTLGAAGFPDGGGAVRLHPLADGGAGERPALVAAALAGYEPVLALLETGEAGEEGARECLRRLGNYRVLCAQRRGPLGSEAMNRLVDHAVRARLGVAPGAAWYRGRFVIVTRNTPELDLFNGDTGVCLARDGALMVAFPSAGGLRWVAVAQMPLCTEAFALTVHQSQGSEFDAVTLVAAPAGHALATRELIYTGITRARRSLEVFAGVGALADAASRPTVRSGLLGERLGAAPSS